MTHRLFTRLRALLLVMLAVSACSEVTQTDSDADLQLQLVSRGVYQEAGAGTPLAAPIVVRVVDAEGRPVVRADVRWRVIEGGGFTSEVVTATDSLGHATVRWTLGEDLGLQLLAEAPHATLTIRATASLAFVRITAGGAHTCAISTTSQVYCWGNNARGQLGRGTAVSKWRRVRLATRARVVEVAAGWSHTCGITEGGPVLCWGDDIVGQLGRQPRVPPRPFPKP